MREPRSAIIVRVRLSGGLERLRRTFVPQSRLGVPAHVTIFYPFLPATSLDEVVRRKLTAAVSATRPFTVEFRRVATFPDAVYLAPDPEAPFVALSRAVDEAFPGLPPYGDPSLAVEDLIPHLTVATGTPAELRACEVIAGSLLPVRATVRQLTVIAEGAGGRWETRWRIRLGGRSATSGAATGSPGRG